MHNIIYICFITSLGVPQDVTAQGKGDRVCDVLQHSSYKFTSSHTCTTLIRTIVVLLNS